jgi:acetyl esterase
MRAASLAGLPPMQVICAECDPLVDDCIAFVERVRDEGGEVALRVFEGVVHGFYTLGKLIPEAREALALSAAAVRAHLVERVQA